MRTARQGADDRRVQPPGLRIARAFGETSILVVLHELGPLERLIDRGVVLKQGRVIYDGPLRSAPGAPDHVADHVHADDDASQGWAVHLDAKGVTR